MAPVTVLICCANCEDTIAAACRSVAWADEVLVVDSGSQDRTGEIAQQHATSYVVEPWRGYTEQKVFGAERAKHDWILIIDGDEECSPRLAEQWKVLTDAELDRVDLISMPRRNYVMGRQVRAWWPDWQTRIFHRRRVTWDSQVLHDKRIPSAPDRHTRLTGWIEHKRLSRAGFNDYFSGRRMDERLMMVAQQFDEAGVRVRWWDLALRPTLAFIKFYVLKRGFLDGTFGLMIAQKAAQSVQLKYAALWAIQNDRDQQSGD